MKANPGYALLIVSCLVVASCSGALPARFYVLSAMEEQPAAVPGKGVAIGIGPITLPQYLNRPQIVTRVGNNRLEVADLDQWGGDLNDNVTRALAANLSSLLKTDRISLYPWKDGAPIGGQVTVDIVNFEQDVDSSSLLVASWSIVDPETGDVKLMRRSVYRDTDGGAQAGASAVSSSRQGEGGRPYDAVVAAMSRNLEALSRDIAAAITNLKRK